MQKDLTVGTRVRLAHQVGRFPHFIVPAGATGTVVENTDQIVRVKLDEHVDGAEDWDNELHWSNDDLGLGEAGSAINTDLEVLA